MFGIAIFVVVFVVAIQTKRHPKMVMHFFATLTSPVKLISVDFVKTLKKN